MGCGRARDKEKAAAHLDGAGEVADVVAVCLRYQITDQLSNSRENGRWWNLVPEPLLLAGILPALFN